MAASDCDLPAIRRRILGQRRALNRQTVRAAALDATRLFWSLPESRRAQRIGVYFAVRNEFDCGPLIDSAIARARQIYLPVLHRGELRFARYRTGDPLVQNRFRIPEPAGQNTAELAASELDLVLAPLVAFDGNGTRLGMGGGYYDRSFRFLQQRRNWSKPRLFGLAYEFQRVDQLQRRAWDIPVHGVLTECAIHRFRNRI